MAVVVGRMLAILEAQTAQFEARMGAAGQQMNRMTSTTLTARRGVTMLRGSLESLAFSGLGLLPPAAARAGAALTTLFVGSPWALAITAIAAAFGALAMAFDRAGKKAQEFVEEAQRVRDFQLQHSEMLAGLGGPAASLTPAEEIANLRQQRARAVALQEHLRMLSMGLTPSGGPLQVAPGTDIPSIAARATVNFNALAEAVRNFNRAIHDLELKQFQRDLEMTARWGSTFARNVGDTRFREGAWMPGEVPQPRMWQGPTPMESARFAGGPAPSADAKGFQFSPQVAQLLMLSMMSAGRGGAGGLFGAAGGLLGGLGGLEGIAGTSAAGPIGWAGFGLSALGSVFGLFDKGEDRRHRELMEETRRIRENTDRRGAPDRTSVTILVNGREISGAILEDVIYGIRRLERRDATPRLPPR